MFRSCFRTLTVVLVLDFSFLRKQDFHHTSQYIIFVLHLDHNLGYIRYCSICCYKLFHFVYRIYWFEGCSYIWWIIVISLNFSVNNVYKRFWYDYTYVSIDSISQSRLQNQCKYHTVTMQTFVLLHTLIKGFIVNWNNNYCVIHSFIHSYQYLSFIHPFHVLTITCQTTKTIL